MDELARRILSIVTWVRNVHFSETGCWGPKMIGKRSWIFLRREENRKVLAWLGSGVVLVATAGWAVFVYFHNESGGGSQSNCTVTAETSVVACDGGVFVDGDLSINDTN